MKIIFVGIASALYLYCFKLSFFSLFSSFHISYITNLIAWIIAILPIISIHIYISIRKRKIQVVSRREHEKNCSYPSSMNMSDLSYGEESKVADFKNHFLSMAFIIPIFGSHLYIMLFGLFCWLHISMDASISVHTIKLNDYECTDVTPFNRTCSAEINSSNLLGNVIYLEKYTELPDGEYLLQVKESLFGISILNLRKK